MSFLYAVTIYPLERVYHFIYLCFVGLLNDNYGLALLLLSLFTTILFIPLKKLVAKIERKERLIQEVIKPQIQRIKEESTKPAEEHLRISKLYERYSYHPIYAARSLFGIVLQLPFLLAAYGMLSNLSVLDGHAFGYITDLSRPDDLLDGFNLLPLIMTLFNITAVFINDGFAVKERIQATLIAVFFLIILYQAPAALLVYWTANNVLLCAQELYAKLAKYGFDKLKRFFAILYTKQLSPFFLLKLTIRFLLFIFCLSLFFHYLDISIKFDSTGKNIYIAFEIIYFFIFILPLIIFSKIINQKNNKINFILILSIYPFFFISLFFESYSLNTVSSTSLIVVYSIVLLRSFSSIASTHFDSAEARLLYANSVLVIAFLLLIFSPVALYASDPTAFNVSIISILVNMLPILAILLIAFCLLWLIIPVYYRNFLSLYTFSVALIFIINSFVFNGNYGSLEGTSVSNVDFFRSLWCVTFDFLTLVILCLALYCLIKFKLSSYVIRGLSLLSLSIVIFSVINIYSIKDNDSVVLTESEQHNLSDDVSQILGYSKEGTNVLVFFIDMFTASHLSDILQEEPQLKDALSGFVWYPDTISAGDSTLLSTASIYGGEKYMPNRLNKEINRNNLEKIHEASTWVANDFGRKGYDIDLLGFGLPAQAKDINKHFAKGLNAKFTPKLPASNVNKWMEKRNIKTKEIDISYYMLVTSLFRAVPHSTKRNIYMNWEWFGAGEELFSNLNFYKIVESVALLDLLPELSSTEKTNNTFKMVYTDLAHSPWHLTDHNLIPVQQPYPSSDAKMLINGIIPEHYYSEKHIIKFLANYFDWMREQGVYDNTYIVLVSDHDAYDSTMLNLALGRDDRNIIRPFTLALNAYPGRPHALLMVKPLGSQDEFQISPSLMATSDVAPLVCSVIDHCQDVQPLIEDKERVRYHYVTTVSWAHDYYENTFNYETHKITGTMFNKNNWLKE